MVTWMIHPKHGQHPATGDQVEGMKANGWTVRPPRHKDRYGHMGIIAGAIVNVFPEATNTGPVLKKRGRKPKA